MHWRAREELPPPSIISGVESDLDFPFGQKIDLDDDRKMIGAHIGPIAMTGGQQATIPLLCGKHINPFLGCKNGLFHRVSRPKNDMCTSF